MIARANIMAVCIMLTACTEAADPAAERDTAATLLSDPAAGSTAVLAGELVPGSWAVIGDGAITGVQFTSPNHPDTLTIGCNAGPGEAFINWTISEAAENGEVRIHTATDVVTFAATGSNEDGHLVNVTADGTDPRFAVLKTAQPRFAVEGFGRSFVVPWAASVAETLNECAG
jgi:hypothetical protein